METIYIRLDKPPRGMDHARSVEGRAAAKNWEKLRTFAQELNTKPLDAFLDNDAAGGAWHRPAEALDTLQRLISRIAANRQGTHDTRHLIRDLNSYANILSSAAARGSKFRFTTEV